MDRVVTSFSTCPVGLSPDVTKPRETVIDIASYIETEIQPALEN
jgi:hypothetical protein